MAEQLTPPTCVICIENLQTDHSTTALSCAHIFHAKCIGQWLKRSPTCPVCRHECKDATVVDDVKINIELPPLRFNNSSRFATTPNAYSIRPYDFLELPSRGVHMYSFALRPDSFQPSGFANFDRF